MKWLFFALSLVVSPVSQLRAAPEDTPDPTIELIRSMLTSATLPPIEKITDGMLWTCKNYVYSKAGWQLHQQAVTYAFVVDELKILENQGSMNSVKQYVAEETALHGVGGAGSADYLRITSDNLLIAEGTLAQENPEAAVEPGVVNKKEFAASYRVCKGTHYDLIQAGEYVYIGRIGGAYCFDDPMEIRNESGKLFPEKLTTVDKPSGKPPIVAYWKCQYGKIMECFHPVGISPSKLSVWEENKNYVQSLRTDFNYPFGCLYKRKM